VFFPSFHFSIVTNFIIFSKLNIHLRKSIIIKITCLEKSN
jgi:hypothetical protein